MVDEVYDASKPQSMLDASRREALRRRLENSGHDFDVQRLLDMVTLMNGQYCFDGQDELQIKRRELHCKEGRDTFSLPPLVGNYELNLFLVDSNTRSATEANEPETVQPASSQPEPQGESLEVSPTWDNLVKTIAGVDDVKASGEKFCRHFIEDARGIAFFQISKIAKVLDVPLPRRVCGLHVWRPCLPPPSPSSSPVSSSSSPAPHPATPPPLADGFA